MERILRDYDSTSQRGRTYSRTYSRSGSRTTSRSVSPVRSLSPAVRDIVYSSHTSPERSCSPRSRSTYSSPVKSSVYRSYTSPSRSSSPVVRTTYERSCSPARTTYDLESSTYRSPSRRLVQMLRHLLVCQKHKSWFEWVIFNLVFIIS